ncbi:MAG: hypothetical protein P8012_09410 [Desulfobacterales bacterium]
MKADAFGFDFVFRLQGESLNETSHTDLLNPNMAAGSLVEDILLLQYLHSKPAQRSTASVLGATKVMPSIMAKIITNIFLDEKFIA